MLLILVVALLFGGVTAAGLAVTSTPTVSSSSAQYPGPSPCQHNCEGNVPNCLHHCKGNAPKCQHDCEGNVPKCQYNCKGNDSHCTSSCTGNNPSCTSNCTGHADYSPGRGDRTQPATLGGRPELASVAGAALGGAPPGA